MNQREIDQLIKQNSRLRERVKVLENRPKPAPLPAPPEFNPDMLKIARLHRDMDHDALSKATGIPVETLKRYELDLKVPTEFVIAQFADVLQRPCNFFFQEGRMLPPDFVCSR